MPTINSVWRNLAEAILTPRGASAPTEDASGAQLQGSQAVNIRGLISDATGDYESDSPSRRMTGDTISLAAVDRRLAEQRERTNRAASVDDSMIQSRLGISHLAGSRRISGLGEWSNGASIIGDTGSWQSEMMAAYRDSRSDQRRADAAGGDTVQGMREAEAMSRIDNLIMQLEAADNRGRSQIARIADREQADRWVHAEKRAIVQRYLEESSIRRSEEARLTPATDSEGHAAMLRRLRDRGLIPEAGDSPLAEADDSWLLTKQGSPAEPVIKKLDPVINIHNIEADF